MSRLPIFCGFKSSERHQRARKELVHSHLVELAFPPLLSFFLCFLPPSSFLRLLSTITLPYPIAPTDSPSSRLAFYQGLSAPIVGAAAENACLFLVYNQCQRLITFAKGSDPNTPPEDKGLDELALAAAGAGAVASFILFVFLFPSHPYLASFARRVVTFRSLPFGLFRFGSYLGDIALPSNSSK